MKPTSSNVLSGPPNGGPSFVAPSLWSEEDGNPGHLLRAQERAELALISPVVRFRKGEQIYGKGDRADAVFNIITGVVKTYKSLPDGSHHIAGFFFADDLVGLAEHGTYVNSAQAVTPVAAYRTPTAALEARLRKNPTLEYHVICKLCHDLRQAQRHAFLLSNERAAAKIALFLEMLEIYQRHRGDKSDEVYLPMSRSDIAEFIGTSLETVSRTFRRLVGRGAIAFRDRRHIKILDPALLQSIIAEPRGAE